MLKKAALLVGIDDYARAPLDGCVADVRALEPLLAKNEDGTPNFHSQILVAPRNSSKQVVTIDTLRSALAEIMRKHVDMLLFYFSGHGLVTPRGGVLVTQEATRNNEGVTMMEIVEAANESQIKEITIVVDACFSGQLGAVPAIKDDRAVIGEGVSILSASAPDEVAIARSGGSVFTSLICGALEGGAADIMGEVTAASVYAYVDQALGPLDQRPMFKANVERLSPLRTCRPGIASELLRKLTTYFSAPAHVHKLDPAYEQDHSQHPSGTIPDAQKEAVFADLQKLRAARLVVPVGEDHMFYAAIRSKGCKLTPLGQYYWRRASDGLL